MSDPLPSEPGGSQAGRPSRGWWWLVVAVGALALLVLLVAEPWSVQTEPNPTGAATQSPTTPVLEPSPTPSVSVAPPGADVMFDATTSLGLFVTAADLVADVPAAHSGVGELVLSGQQPWGLPEGTVVDPDTCALAVTVVSAPPAFYDARTWGNDAMDFQQELTVLPDPAAAREAFRELVTTIDACPTYREVSSGVDGAQWTARPAIEGQGVYPSIVLQIDRAVGGTTVPGYQGQMLVGNTIVSWTAQALAAGSSQTAALATLGDPSSLSAMVQGRAQLAVRALG